MKMWGVSHTWVHKRVDTVDDQFVRLDGSKVPVKMMQSTSPLAYAEGAGYQAATLPYQSRDGRTFEMMVVVPTADFATFEASFDATKLAAGSPMNTESTLPGKAASEG